VIAETGNWLRAIILAVSMLAYSTNLLSVHLDCREKDIPQSQKEWLVDLKRNEREAYKYATVTATGINVPVGRWALIRKDGKSCALRFTSFHRAHPDEACIRDTEETFYADYEWVFFGDKNTTLTNSNIRKGSGKVSKKPNIWRIRRGVEILKCGPFEAAWWYPNGIALIAHDFDPSKANRSNGLEIAVTGWTSIANVDMSDPRLVWHFYDPVRDLAHIRDAPFSISIEDLPGYMHKPGS